MVEPPGHPVPEHPAPEARLLIVDDEPNIVELLSVSLRFAGFEVATAANGPDAVTAVQLFQPDLVVLDVMMPGMDGLTVLRELRVHGCRIPVVFLTARDAVEEKVRGLTLGGDDYVTKPFSLAEVLARIRAVLRRVRDAGAPGNGNGTDGNGAGTPASRLSFADVELDDETHEVWKDGEPVALSPTEFKLLRYLIQNSGRVLSKMQILDHVWNYDFGGDVGIVESYVSYLRKKIDKDEPRLIHTLRGVGYIMRIPQ
ncbi:response regulator transcription factor [Frankia sp. Cppng1_Ct_nod]|uniref:response regulator transcription factor n=1 Tax=Frankia sp. Cppng1_Ct_nod TaxID=2897162 RepID=UPI0010413BF8|nr:response regulator transcription factor [Frankia sp. Cppng1_Ct_nod]